MISLAGNMPLQTLIVVFAVFFILREVLTFLNIIPAKYLFTPLVTLTVLMTAVFSGSEHTLDLYRILIIGALSLSLVADVLLMIVETDLMIYGIVFFLLAHIFYFCAFILGYSFQTGHLAIAVSVALSVTGIFLVTGRDAGSLKIPVAVYTLILGGMVFAALTSKQGLVIAGALLFALSDTLIAINAFRRTIPHSTVFTWALYGPAQMLFALSCYCSRM